MLIYQNNRDKTWVLIDDFDQVWNLEPTDDRVHPLTITLLSGAFATPAAPLEEPAAVPPPPSLAPYGVD